MHATAVSFVASAKTNVSAASGHIGGNRDGTHRTRFRNDCRFFSVLLGVEYPTVAIRSQQPRCEHFRLFNAGGSYEHRTTSLVQRQDFAGQCVILPDFCRENAVRKVLPNARTIWWHDDSCHLIKIIEFLGRFLGGSGHPAHSFILLQKMLQRNGIQDFSLRMNLDPLFRFDRRLQTIRPATIFSHPARQFVDQLNRTIPY